MEKVGLNHYDDLKDFIDTQMTWKMFIKILKNIT